MSNPIEEHTLALLKLETRVDELARELKIGRESGLYDVIAALHGTHKPAKGSFWSRLSSYLNEKTLTLGLVLVTCWLALESRWLAHDWRETSARQIGVQTWLALQSRFDSSEFKQVRKNLAEQLLLKEDPNHNGVQEELFEFFEAVANLYNHELINEDLVISSLGFYAVRYWEGCKPFIEKDRLAHPEGQSLYSEFQHFAQRMREETGVNEEKAKQELDGFLKSERDDL